MVKFVFILAILAAAFPFVACGDGPDQIIVVTATPTATTPAILPATQIGTPTSTVSEDGPFRFTDYPDGSRTTSCVSPDHVMGNYLAVMPDIRLRNSTGKLVIVSGFQIGTCFQPAHEEFVSEIISRNAESASATAQQYRFTTTSELGDFLRSTIDNYEEDLPSDTRKLFYEFSSGLYFFLITRPASITQ